MKKIKILSTLVMLFILNFNFSQSWNEIIKIVANDRNAGDLFGYSVGISGNYAVVGARHGSKDTNGLNPMNSAGSAHVFEKSSSGNWVQKQKIISSDRAASDEFGFSVAISGNYILVGAPQEDEDEFGGNTRFSAGAGYIFERNSSGIWSQTQKIVSSDRGGADDNFGWSVSISGNNLIVGARQEREDEFGTNTITAAGGAYIFQRDISGVWTETQKIVGTDRGPSYQFGWSVSISNDKAAVGSFWDEKNSSGISSLNKAGAVYIFEKDASGIWIMSQKVVASDRDSNDIFGVSVSVSGDYVIVGASQESNDSLGANSLLNSGSAYIFSKNASGSWLESAKLVASDRDVNDRFGTSVSISGNRAIVGSGKENEDEFGMNTIGDAGSSYIFERDNNGNWSQIQKIVASDRQGGDNFGSAVGISNNQIIVAAMVEDHDENGGALMSNSGSCYIFSTPFTANIDEKQIKISLEIYPNPTNSILNIESSSSYKSGRVINPLGQIVLEFDKAKQVDVSSIAVGTYSILFYSENQEVLVSKKLVIQ